MTKTCTWSEDEDGVWDTSCGNRFEIEAGSPEENGFKFCCYCGGALEQVYFLNEDLDE